MARRGFFDSTTASADPVTGLPVGDNAEGSDFLADTLHTILGNGVSMEPTSNLLVQTKTGLIVTLKAGKLWKNGYKLWETADRDITFTSSASEQTFYISGRLDVANNEFTHDEVYPYTTFVAETDVCVAKIVIPANALTITDAMITDYRYNTTYCGVVDEYRLQLESIAADFETALVELESVGIPHHASTHASGAADAIAPSDIGAESSTLTTSTKTDNYTILASDNRGKISMNSSSDKTFTFATQAVGSYPDGMIVFLKRLGTGAVTIAGSAGVTFQSAGNRMKIAEQYAWVFVRKIATDAWEVVGSTSL